MDENLLEGRKPYALANDIEDVMQLIQAQISNEDDLLVLDLIQLLRTRVDRLENKVRGESL